MTAAAQDVAASPSVERENVSVAALEVKGFGKCKSEFIPKLQVLLATYKVTTRLKWPQNYQSKQIHSYIQGYDGTEAECYKCSELAPIEHLENHHIDNNPNNNKLENVPPIHGLCNRQLNGAKGGEINRQRAAAFKREYPVVGSALVRENAGRAHAQPDADYGNVQWTSKEGKKHDKMRFKWNKNLWRLFNPEDEEQNCMLRGELAARGRSRHLVGEGTITTFYKMIQEDVACGILREDIETGTGAELLRFIWPSEELRPYLRELALQHIQGKLTDQELKEKIEVINTGLEFVQLWSYVWYVQKKIGKTATAEK